jgi:hypothetical protein
VETPTHAIHLIFGHSLRDKNHFNQSGHAARFRRTNRRRRRGAP